MKSPIHTVTRAVRNMQPWQRIVAATFLAAFLFGIDHKLKVVHYEVPAKNIDQPVRIALVTDLHSCFYGEGQHELLDALNEQNPDVILLGGDIFDDALPNDNTVTFLQGVCNRYPCYYVTGNHEYLRGEAPFKEKMALLEQCGATRLSGEVATIEVGGSRICVCGVDDPDAWRDWRGFTERTEGDYETQVAQVAAMSDPEAYTILLAHRPERFGMYCQYDFDLVLVGHAHGGQVRIPGVLNGLYSPNQGLFPKYAGGQYEQNGTTMIVSRGLGREDNFAPRVYNPPELVIVDLT